jgi:hypothetical protein
MEGIMPVRFRRSFTIFPGVKVNVSKGGFSISVGKKGATLNFSKRGVRQTVGIPGSGISESSYIMKNKPDDDEKKSSEKDDRPAKEDFSEAKDHDDAPERKGKRRGAPAWILLVGIVVIYIGAVILSLVPADFLSQLLGTLTNWARQVGL